MTEEQANTIINLLQKLIDNGVAQSDDILSNHATIIDNLNNIITLQNNLSTELFNYMCFLVTALMIIIFLQCVKVFKK